MQRTASLVLICAGFLAGCNEPAPKTPPAPPPAKSGIEIKAPGVDIKIDKDKDGGADVDVKAPGADVKIDDK